MKQLLNKILPNFIIKFLIKQKYKKHNIGIHQQNIQEDKIVKVDCKEKYEMLKTMFYKSFGGLLKVENDSLYFHPVAIIEVPKSIDEYLKQIGAKSRNMNKKAEKFGVKCQEFNWNEYLDDVYEINNSSTQRQGREMDSSYREYPNQVEYPKNSCFKIVHIGAFLDDKLIGYVELYIYNNFAMTNRILGHKEYLKYAVMNIMIKECVEYAIQNNIEYINYLTMQNRKNNSLSAFKNRVGFREYSLLELK